MSGVEIASIITAVTALVGTVGGLIISYRTLQRSYWKNNIRIKVEGKAAYITGQKGEQFSVKVANMGEKDFTVSMIAVKVGRYSGNLVIPMPKGTVGLPYILEPGKTCDFWQSFKDLEGHVKKMTKRKHIKLRASVTDYLGKTFYSKPIRYTLKETWMDRFSKRLNDIRIKTLKALFS